MIIIMLLPSYVLANGYDAALESICKNIIEKEEAYAGGEWTAIGIARSGIGGSENYLRKYTESAAGYIAEKNGVLHERKYTEYSRMILALTAAGEDAADFAGYDLTAPLSDFEKTSMQGINGSIWALIALDSGGYKSAQRDKYADNILSHQNDDGGWAFAEGDNRMRMLRLWHWLLCQIIGKERKLKSIRLFRTYQEVKMKAEDF